MKLCIVQPSQNKYSETFLRAHANLLPFNNTVDYFVNGIPHVNDTPILSQSLLWRGVRKLNREVRRKPWHWEVTTAFVKLFRDKADIVLAEYGNKGVVICEAANITRTPLVVHFHGADASRYSILDNLKDKYKQLFKQAAAVIAVSSKMKNDLISLGAPENKIFINPCGVDTDIFQGAVPENTAPIFLTVGRFVEKKAPYLSILAFSKILSEHPDAKLKMIGDGPLLGVCKHLVQSLGLNNSVLFLGVCSHEDVIYEMFQARAFIQHSIQASDGDSEGTPVSIMEAQSIGLPVISTKHAGIIDVVDHGDTGYLVEEKDIQGMSFYMNKFLHEPYLAAKFGQNGRKKIIDNFSMQYSIDNLANIIKFVKKKY